MSILGTRVVRVEDPRFLTGQGTYIANLDLPGAVHVTYVRSTMAHARIVSIDTTAAKAMPGVVAGTILVFIPVMGTFIVSDILGGRQVILVGNLIQRQFLDARDPTFGSAASLILMVMTLKILMATVTWTLW